jgi:electron transport complex protein RnfG
MIPEEKTGFGTKILNNKIYPIIFLSIIVFIAVLLLMLVNSFTQEKIIAEREAKVTNVLERIYPEMEDFELKDDIYIILKDGEPIGYSFIAVGKGYGGDINTIVGLDKDYLVKEISVLSNTETPGLGTKILEAFFTDQFKGLEVQDVKLSKDGGKIDAISGATISSRAVTDSVRGAIEEKLEIIKSKNY